MAAHAMSQIHSIVREHIPLEQGLRRCNLRIRRRTNLFSSHIPLEQGLRQPIGRDVVRRVHTRCNNDLYWMLGCHIMVSQRYDWQGRGAPRPVGLVCAVISHKKNCTKIFLFRKTFLPLHRQKQKLPPQLSWLERLIRNQQVMSSTLISGSQDVKT